MSAGVLRDAAGDSTPGSDGGERITRLFPKCRPRNMQHQHDRLNSGLEGRDMISVNNVSSDDERDDQPVILSTKGGTYKLRDSRIIEIAGGRELYSQSRAKAVRKLRHNNAHKHNLRNKVRSLTKDSVDYTVDNNINNEISIHRITNEPKKMISRHTSPVAYTNGDREPVLEQNTMGIPKNSSPILDPHKTNDVSTKSSPIAVVADGEVMVFDENDDWKVILNSVSLGLRMDPDASDDEIDISVKRTLDNIKNGDSDILNNKSELSCDGSDSTRSREDVRLSEGSPTGVWLSGDEDKSRFTRVIGELPIAEYEGSPRRYGVGSQKIQVRSPRPGFPQRVVTTDSRDVTPPPSSAAFDYLYEFSETRKVLEEFFRCPTLPGQHQNSTEEIVNFQELDYELRRQTQDCPSENGIDGSESDWPQNEGLESPHALNNHTDFLGLQQKQRARFPTPDVAALQAGDDGSPCVSPTHQADLHVALALSSAASDTASELSMAIMENELVEMKEPIRRTLPIVEDGLSSGHASDTDNNNPMIQTHSVTIEEIVDSGTNSDPHMLSDADLHSLDPLATAPPPPAPAPHRPAEPSPHAVHTPHSSHAHTHSHTPLPSHTPHHHHHDDVYPRKRPTSAQSTESVEIKPASGDEDEADTDLETDRLLGQQRTDDQGFFDDKGWRKPKSRTVMPSGGSTGTAREHTHDSSEHRDEDPLHNGKDKDGKKKSKNKEDLASVLIEGVLFRARYLGSTQLACEGQPTKATRMLQAEEAVSRIKALAPEGENQPSTEVDLFISTEKIMVLNTELKEIMMDHALRTISYIADIGDLVVLMARRRFVPHETDSDQPKLNRTPKMICHVFESEEAQFIAQSIGQAFQVAYMEFLKANGIEDHSFVKEMDYQEVLNSQEIFGDELQMFAKKELQKEVVVPKTKGEILGVVVVESGWGSMLPTVVIANLAPAGAAARCGQLNIGDQIIAINGVSLVGLPLSTCQTYIKNSKNQTVVKLTVVPCAPVVEVKIKRPDTKYQLGFSVQNGVICSLLRGGIAERGGVRVGHRIIEINSQSVVAVPHERIVNLLATSVGEILMKTMPTSMFRLLTGQENPVFI
ncbi:protein lin-10-like isoform X4 [Maniola jurtina]|uniref:protein lin-10-like isoform X4 n=1 Tax=Maniola jurtina TaxID=191418 RepID=UPI001E68B391|nr:protein lin-10-like isoform X4 [Maniola jurtina]